MTLQLTIGAIVIITAITAYLFGLSAGSKRDIPVKRINETLNESTPAAKAYIKSLWDVKR